MPLFIVKRTAVLLSSMQTPEIGMTSVTFFEQPSITLWTLQQASAMFQKVMK